MASTEKSMRNNKNQNIQVFVRLRPLNQRERAIRSLGVVEVVNNREVVVRQSQQTSHTKKFTFDRAFGPNTEQVEVYKEVVSPLIAEVLAGYNCTVFAYGQTGTGKTHTMVGESTGEGTTWQNDPLAGIIPRALSQLFDELRISNSEYTVRVSYLELYNEELFDLLSSSEDNSKLRIYEDVTRKGSTIVNGLEEVTVYNKNEVYEIMAEGQERKKVASTLMNAQSSNHPSGNPKSQSPRSHTVFTIVVHMKENCPKGEELVKIGKLNLVDLAGSENISKAGSDNPAKRERARECVNINQSLLTLGRVITALVEKHPHIPYRESKLTRILQESLGGRTKTSIIATVSPGHKDLEETMSTLEYAHRAKNIQNKPEVNQKLTKQAILKEFAEEIDKLKRELTASREKNGVYLPTETYEELLLKQDEHRREIQELLLKKRACEEERARMQAVFSELDQRVARTEGELRGARGQLERTAKRLAETEQLCLEQEHLLENHVQTESEVAAQARQLVAAADGAAGDAASLHDTVDRRRTLESANQQAVGEYREQATAHRAHMLSDVQQSTDCFMGERDHMQAAIDDHARDTSMAQERSIQDMQLLVAKMGMIMNEVKSLVEESESRLSGAAGECRAEVSLAAGARHEALRAAAAGLERAAAEGARRAAAADLAGAVQRSTDHWLKDAGARVQCLEGAHAQYETRARALEARRGEGARAHHARWLARLRARDDAITACITELEKDKKAIEERIVALVEGERRESELRLQRWAQEESERLARHDAELAEHRRMLAESTARCVRMQQMQLEANREEVEVANAYLQQCGSETDERLKSTDEYGKEFGEGSSAISAEMEAFSRSVVQIVGHASEQLVGEMLAAHDAVQQGVNAVLTSDAEATQRCTAAVEAAVGGAVDTARRNLNKTLETVVESSSGTVETLSEVCSRTSRLAQACLEHQGAQTSRLARAALCVQRLGDGVREHTERLADAEGRYLMKEYRVYTPSGSTPARREYVYPRRVAATSPHERILARFRAARTPGARAHAPKDSLDSDCIVIESDDGRHTSDSDASESSVSEDSAVAMQ